jgi:hypothetical protein
MTTPLTQAEAFEDFLRWIKQQPSWKEMTRREKQYIYKARQAQRQGRLGTTRIVGLFDKYAPDRYRVEVSFVLLKE